MILLSRSGSDGSPGKQSPAGNSTSAEPSPSLSIPTALPSELPSNLPSKLPSEVPSDLESLIPSLGDVQLP
ncbi:hypothetical protein ACIRPX_37720 [Streptomyces sp. NPDC101225]|uniref:hypothetical protein n=1 Tax=Streptomyces sp. NPDC101225 TaxID=3366135 RepID=UPI003803E162